MVLPRPHRLRPVAWCLVAAAALSGCSGSTTPSSAQSSAQSSADCAAQVRVDDVVYTSNGFTRHPASRYGSADRADCEDVGQHPRGSVFSDEPDQVVTWRFEGYPPDEVLGVRSAAGSFAVFVADPVPRAEQERIYADLRRRR